MKNKKIKYCEKCNHWMSIPEEMDEWKCKKCNHWNKEKPFLDEAKELKIKINNINTLIRISKDSGRFSDLIVRKDKLKKEVKELKEKIEKDGCGEMIPTGIPPLIHACCKPCIGLITGKYPYDCMCEDCQKALKICEEILE